MKCWLYQSFKGVEKKIPCLLEKLRVRILDKNYTVEKALKQRARFYNVICEDRQKNKYFLKARLQKTREVLKDIKREIEVLRFLSKINREKKFHFLLPKFIKQGIYRGVHWYLREYQQGKLAGQMKFEFGFKTSFLKDCRPQELAKALLSLQKISLPRLKKLKFYKHGGWWYGQDFRYYKDTFIKAFLNSKLNKNLLSHNDIEKIESVFKENKKFLDKKTDRLSHGDLYPNNILFTPDKKISILDLGLVHLNNSSFDPAMVWLQARKNRKWQREFLKFFLEREGNDFKKLFQISLISLTVRLAGYCHWRLTTNKNEYPTLTSKFRSPVFSIFVYYLKTLKLALYEPEKIYGKI